MSPVSLTRVFVLASSPLVRAGLRSMLANAVADTDIEVVGDASPGGSEIQAALSSADVVLLSGDALTDLPEEAGFAARALILLSEDETAAYRLSLLKDMSVSGWGAISPDASTEEIAAAIGAVANGLVVLSGALSERLLEGHPAFVDLEEGLEKSPEPLTAREKEVLELLSRGLANKAIARGLSISEHTVKFHVSSVYAKLEVQSRAGAVSRGARLGLIKL